MMAPIVPHMAEDVWRNLPYPHDSTPSVFEKGWVGDSEKFPAHDLELWTFLRAVRNDVNGCIERARAAKLVGASQECQIVLYSNSTELTGILQKLKGTFPFHFLINFNMFIVFLYD